MPTSSSSRLVVARFDRAARAVVLALVAAHVAAAPLRAESTPCCLQPRPQDQVWLVSNRGLGCDVERQVGNLKVWRYDAACAWTPSSLAELLATDDPQVTTTIFVHGNRIDAGEAFTKGWTAYRTLVACADERPLRFVIWSWPSEAVRGPVNDAREKAYRTDPAGYCLGWFVDRIHPDVSIGLWAHSFGARVVTGGLHLLGGGEIGGYRLDQRQHATRQPMQVVLLVAAIDNDWLMSGHHHGRAMSQVSEMLLVNNGCDALLKRYRLIYGRRCPQQALGYTGLCRGYVAEDAWQKIRQIDASCQVGKRHTFDRYLCSPDLVAHMRPYLLTERVVAGPSLGEAVAVAAEDEPGSSTE